MNILYHHRTRAEDAQGIHIREMVNAFQQLGHKVEVAGLINADEGVTGSQSSGLINRLAAKAPYWLYEIMELAYNLYALLYLSRKIKRFRPDVIYERYALFTFAGVLVARLYKVPFILEVNAPLAYEKKRYAKLFFARTAQAIERFVCSKAYSTVVVSTPLKDIMVNCGVPEGKLTVIPNGINPDVFRPQIDGSAVRDRYGLNDAIVLGFVGWMRKWHGLEQLLEVYDRYRMREKHIALLLVGDGPAVPDLQALAESHGYYSNGVYFAGSVARIQVPQHIAAFDLALQPDVTDYACPIKTVEYLGMGKGIIAPDKPNIKELLSPDYPGLFEAGNWDSMAETIVANASSRDDARHLAWLSRHIMESKQYSWLKNAQQTLALLDPNNTSNATKPINATNSKSSANSINLHMAATSRASLTSCSEKEHKAFPDPMD